jgi:hypothetical protein
VAFVSGSFRGSALGWSTLDKEAYGVVETVDRLDHVLAGINFRLFTDHKNLVPLLTGNNGSAKASRQTSDRLARWRARLDAYRFTIHHIAGEDNVWADMLSRFGATKSLHGRTESDPRVSTSPSTASVTTGAEVQHDLASLMTWEQFTERVRARGLPTVPTTQTMVEEEISRAAEDSATTTERVAAVTTRSRTLTTPAATAATASVTAAAVIAASTATAAAPVDTTTPSAASTAASAVDLAQIEQQHITPDDVLRFSWSDMPTEGQIRHEQKEFFAAGGTTRLRLHRDEETDLMVSSTGQVYVPARHALQLRVIVIAHAGSGGHRGQETTAKLVRERFCWDNMQEDCNKFVASCLHCTTSRGALGVPRPAAETAHADRVNQRIHFDIVMIEHPASTASHRHHSVMVVKDDFSGYVALYPLERTTAEAAASALMQWFSTFGVATQWTSDQGSHFCNDLMKELRDRLHCEHHFTTAYSAWCNGTVEVVNKELLFTLRAMCSEWRLDFNEWPRLLPTAQAALNSIPARRLGGLTPHHVFFGRSESRPIDVIMGQPAAVVVGDVGAAAVVAATAALSEALEQMHRGVSERADGRPRSRQSAVSREAVIPSFSVGDYVLVARIKATRQSKLQSHWTGPHQVMEYVPNSGNLVFVVMDLVHKTQSRVHAKRMRFFADRLLNVTAAMRDVMAAASQHGRNDEYYADRILSHRKDGGVWLFEVGWSGFEDVDSTHEVGDELRGHAEQLLMQYVRGLPRGAADKKELLVTFGRAST